MKRFLGSFFSIQATPISEPERQVLVPYSTKANASCELGRKKIGKNEPCSPQKAFDFVEYGTRSCLSGSDRGVVWRKSNTKFRITFRYLNMYVSTQKLPQIFLYIPITCCESFKSFGVVGKKFFISNFYDPEILAPAKNSMNLPGFYAVLVSSAQTKHWLRSSPMYREQVQQKFESIGLFAWVLYSF